MFSVRNMMIDIPANFSKANRDMKCICGEIKTMKHLYICEQLSSETSELEYEEIYNGNIDEQIRVFRRFEQNFEVRNKLKNSSPCDNKCDLLISAVNSFG